MNFKLTSAHNTKVRRGWGGGGTISGIVGRIFGSLPLFDVKRAISKVCLRKYIRFGHVSRFDGNLLVSDKRIKKFAINKFSLEDKNNFSRIL